MIATVIMDKEKPKKWEQKFWEEYKTRFPCITLSRKGDKFSFCRTCRDDINISYGGAMRY